MADKKNTFILRSGGCNMVHGKLGRAMESHGWQGTGDFKFTLTVDMTDTKRNFYSELVDMGIPEPDGHPQLGTVDPWKVDYPRPRDWTKIINKPSYKKAHPTDWAYHVTKDGQSKMHLRWEWHVNMQIEVWGPDPKGIQAGDILLWKSVYTDPDAEYDLDWDGKTWPSETTSGWFNTIWNFSSFFPEGENRLDKAYRTDENNIYFSFDRKDTDNESWDRRWQKLNYWHTDHPRYDKNPVAELTNENYAEEQPLMFPPTSSHSPYNFKKSWLDDLETYDFRFVYDKTIDYYWNAGDEEWKPRQLLPASQGVLKGDKSTYDDTDTDGNGVPDVFEP